MTHWLQKYYNFIPSPPLRQLFPPYIHGFITTGPMRHSALGKAGPSPDRPIRTVLSPALPGQTVPEPLPAVCAHLPVWSAPAAPRRAAGGPAPPAPASAPQHTQVGRQFLRRTGIDPQEGTHHHTPQPRQGIALRFRQRKKLFQRTSLPRSPVQAALPALRRSRAGRQTPPPSWCAAAPK